MAQSKHSFFPEGKNQNTKGQSDQSKHQISIWSSWWSWLASEGLCSPTPPVLLPVLHMDSLLDQLHSMSSAFLDRYPIVLAFPVPWNLYCNLGFIFIASYNGLSGHICRVSNHAPQFLALALFWNHGRKLHDNLASFLPPKPALYG